MCIDYCMYNYLVYIIVLLVMIEVVVLKHLMMEVMECKYLIQIQYFLILQIHLVLFDFVGHMFEMFENLSMNEYYFDL